MILRAVVLTMGLSTSLGWGATTFDRHIQMTQAYQSAVYRNLRNNDFSAYREFPADRNRWADVSGSIRRFSVSLSRRRENTFVRIYLQIPGTTNERLVLFSCHFHRGGFNIDCHEFDTDEHG